MSSARQGLPQAAFERVGRCLWILASVVLLQGSNRVVWAGEPDAPTVRRVAGRGSAAEVAAGVLSANPQARMAADGTVFLGKGPPEQSTAIRLLNLNAADTTNADQLWLGGELGLNLTGLGVTVGLWDGGRVRSTHQELTGRVTLVDSATTSDHSTHVAGTIGATGVVASARGMASQILIRSRTYIHDTNEMNTDADVIDLSNHSYANLRGWTTRIVWDGLPEGTDTWFADRTLYSEDPYFGKYEGAANVLDLLFGSSNQIANAKALDNVLFNHSHLLAVWAAGNDRGESFTNALGTNQYVTYRSDGPSGAGFYLVTSSGSFTAPERDGGALGFDTLAQGQVAKNTLVVGSVNDVTLDPYAVGNVVVSSFSSCGPPDDGRVKPDVAANGLGLYSCIGTSNTAYAYYSGTSMASPNACGTIALLLEHYRNLNAGASPTGATLKTLVIHTAFDASAVGPDYWTGWGLVDGAAAAAFLSDSESASPDRHHLFEGTYAGATQEFVFNSNGTEPLKATLGWTDPPPSVLPGGGLDDGTKVLVNDLDLLIIGPPGSTSYYPWTLDVANPSAGAVRTARNDVDNVEQVLIDSPPAGMYTVRVSHSGGSFTQAYSLLIGGGALPPPAPADPTASTNLCGDKTLTRTGSPPAGVTWYWQGTSCGTRTDLGSGPTWAAGSSGTYYLRARDDANGGWSIDCGSVTVTVNPLPATPTNAQADPPVICPGGSSTLSASVSGAEIDWYTASCGGVFVGTGNSISVSPASTTTYYARARDGGTGCESAGCDTVTVTVDFPAVISGWRSVREHETCGELAIVLDPAAADGDVVSEPRQYGIQKIEVDIGGPADGSLTLDGTVEAEDAGSPGTTWPATNQYLLDLGGGSYTLVAEWAGGLPDRVCYRIDLAGNLACLVGDTDCLVRGLVGDTSGSTTGSDGKTNLIDAGAVKSLNGTPAGPGMAQYDGNMDGVINLIDFAMVRGLNGNSASCP